MHDLQRREVKKVPTLRGRTIINFFFEDSTRTRSSFEIAGKWMSADTINLSAKGSSTSKGESLRDTAMTVDAMAVDALVIRHHASGACHQVAQWVRCSVINAGDGTHEHPTQALLDAYTLRTRLGDLDGKHVVIVGDLTHSRVFRSNVITLKTLGARVTVVAPPTLMPSGIAAWSAADGFATSWDLDPVLDGDSEHGPVDAVMMLRVQRERMSGGFFPTAREYTVGYGLTRDRLERLVARNDDVLVLHPGPMNRGLEIAPEAADAPQSVVLDQVSAGVAVRMAVLYHLLAGEDTPPAPPPAAPPKEPSDDPPRDPRRPPPRRPRPPTCSSRTASSPRSARCPPPADAEVLDADGLVALPGLVDLHVHLREPGREDAETIATGSAAAAAGGFTAVFAMANTSPVTDTAEAAERVLDLGRACGLTEVVPVGAVTKGLEGAELAELGLMARSRAKVRVFSDDGHCVHDARIMRRALEYVKPFGGVISQHAQDPRLAGREACCHEGEVSGRLGLPGWPGIAEESIVARDVMLARHTGSRVHVAHVSTAGTVEVIRWAKAQGIDGHGRGHAAPPGPDHRPARRTTTPSSRSTRRCVRPRTSRRCARPSRTAPSTPSRPTMRRTRATTRSTPSSTPRSACWASRRPCRSSATCMVRPGLLDWADVARVMSSAPARIGGLAHQGRELAVGSPAHITLVDPDREVTVDAAASRSRSRNNPWHGRTLRGAVLATVHAGRVTHDVRNGADTRRELTNATTTGADL